MQSFAYILNATLSRLRRETWRFENEHQNAPATASTAVGVASRTWVNPRETRHRSEDTNPTVAMSKSIATAPAQSAPCARCSSSPEFRGIGTSKTSRLASEARSSPIPRLRRGITTIIKYELRNLFSSYRNINGHFSYLEKHS